MKRILLVLGILTTSTICSGFHTVSFGQQGNAQTSAQTIIDALGNQKYKIVWDKYTSQWFRTKVTEDAFLANMSMGRAQLGVIQKSSLVSSDHSTSDPATGYQGDIYAFTYRDKYSVGEFYERIVLIKEPDGQYRMSGLFGSPVPAQ